MASKSKTKMREIVLKQFDQEGSEKPFCYHVVMINACHAPKNPQVGTTTKEMREVMPILDKLEAVEPLGTIHLTESEWKEVKDRIAGFKFGSNARLVVEFEDALKAAPEVPFQKSGEPEE